VFLSLIWVSTAWNKLISQYEGAEYFSQFTCQLGQWVRKHDQQWYSLDNSSHSAKGLLLKIYAYTCSMLLHCKSDNINFAALLPTLTTHYLFFLLSKLGSSNQVLWIQWMGNSLPVWFFVPTFMWQTCCSNSLICIVSDKLHFLLTTMTWFIIMEFMLIIISKTFS